jgi:hypothetical protein
MIGCIPFITNDYTLSLIYIGVIVVSLSIYHKKNEFYILLYGFCIMILAEYFFVSTGVETFTRTTLFGLMPLWLPFLWAYGFVVIKRSVEILNT